MKCKDPYRQRNEPKQDLGRNIGDDARESKVLQFLTERTRVFRGGVRFIPQADKERGQGIGGRRRRIVARRCKEEVGGGNGGYSAGGHADCAVGIKWGLGGGGEGGGGVRGEGGDNERTATGGYQGNDESDDSTAHNKPDRRERVGREKRRTGLEGGRDDGCELSLSACL